MTVLHVHVVHMDFLCSASSISLLDMPMNGHANEDESEHG